MLERRRKESLVAERNEKQERKCRPNSQPNSSRSSTTFPFFDRRWLLFCYQSLLFSFLLLLLLPLQQPVMATAMNMPSVPNSWEKCADQRSCQNEGTCYSDGISEFCICDEGYGGKKCERLIDSVVLFDSTFSADQLAAICKVAFLAAFCALLAAFLGWACCCAKHLNARRLYLQNLKLARDNQQLHRANQHQSRQTVSFYAALARANGLVEVGQQQPADLSPSTERSQTIAWADTSTSRRPFGTLEAAAGKRPILGAINGGDSDQQQQQATAESPSSPSQHRVLMRQLSEMHDEIKKSIEQAHAIEILHEPAEDVEEEQQTAKEEEEERRKRRRRTMAANRLWKQLRQWMIRRRGRRGSEEDEEDEEEGEGEKQSVLIKSGSRREMEDSQPLNGPKKATGGSRC